MNIFNYLSNILFTKKDKELKTLDQQSDYQPFLINRWCSMLNKQTCQIVNTTTNTMYQVFENKTDHYKFLHYVIPRERFKRINYIKKIKQEKDQDDDTRLIAKNMQLSTREVREYKQLISI